MQFLGSVDVNILRHEILNIMLAGRDTTAAALTFCTYFLCMYPDSRKRLREEIMQRLGPDARPTSEDIRELKYLRAFINGKASSFRSDDPVAHRLFVETLRLFPPV